MVSVEEARVGWNDIVIEDETGKLACYISKVIRYWIVEHPSSHRKKFRQGKDESPQPYGRPTFLSSQFNRTCPSGIYLTYHFESLNIKSTLCIFSETLH